MRSFVPRAGAPFVGAWLLVAQPAAAAAQAAVAPAPLSIQQAIEEALARNPELLALARDYERARLVPDTARGFDPPTFEAAIWRWPINSINPANTEMYMFSMSQALPQRDRREREAELAGADAALAESAIAVRARRIIDEVKRTWAEVYLARERRLSNDDAQALLRQAADIAMARYSTGEAPQQDALAAMVELSRLHEQASRIDEDERRAVARMNVLLDRRPDAPLGALGAPLVSGPLPTSAELQDLAIAHEPGLRSAGLAVERARAALALVATEREPTIQIGGGYMLMPRMGDAWMASVGISWPQSPWSKGRIDSRAAVAAADVAVREAERRAAENDVRLAVHDALVRVQGAEQRVALFESGILPQAEQAVVVARAGYEAGRGTFLALVDSQRVLLDARLDVHRARAERAEALADLERAVGVDFSTPDAQADRPRSGGTS